MNLHTVRPLWCLLWFGTDGFYTYLPGLGHWHWCSASEHEYARTYNVITTNKSTRKLCAYYVGCTYIAAIYIARIMIRKSLVQFSHSFVACLSVVIPQTPLISVHPLLPMGAVGPLLELQVTIKTYICITPWIRWWFYWQWNTVLTAVVGLL